MTKLKEIKSKEPVKKELTFDDRLKIYQDFQIAKKNAKADGILANIEDIIAREKAWLESIVKRLEPEIKKGQFLYKLVKRGKKTLIYAQHPIIDGIVGETPYSYEVFASKISPPKIAFKKPYEAYELFPGDSVFGIWAWACSSIENAESRFQEIEKGNVNEEDSELNEEEDSDD